MILAVRTDQSVGYRDFTPPISIRSVFEVPQKKGDKMVVLVSSTPFDNGNAKITIPKCNKLN